MQIKTSRMLLLLSALAMPLLVSCDSGGGANNESLSGEDGEVTVKLKRSKIEKAVGSPKDVNPAVDSAFVRAWKSDVYNQAKYVAVPEPGNATEVSLQVPAAAGYRAGVLAVESDSAEFDSELPYAVGTTESTFEVTAGGTSNVSPTMRSLRPSIQVPASVGELEKDTIRVELGNVEGFDPDDISAMAGTKSGFNYFDGTPLDQTGLLSTDPNTIARGIEIGNTDANTIYVKIEIDFDDNSRWRAGTDGSLSDAFFPNPGDGPNGTGTYEIPVSSSSDDTGSIVITF